MSPIIYDYQIKSSGLHFSLDCLFSTSISLLNFCCLLSSTNLFYINWTLFLLKLVLPLEFIIHFNNTIFLLKFWFEFLLKLWLFMRLLPPTTTPMLCLIQLGHKRHRLIVTYNTRLLSIFIAASQVQVPIIPLLDILIVSHCFPVLFASTISKFICLLIIAQYFWKCVLIMTFHY